MFILFQINIFSDNSTSLPPVAPTSWQKKKLMDYLLRIFTNTPDLPAVSIPSCLSDLTTYSSLLDLRP